MKVNIKTDVVYINIRFTVNLSEKQTCFEQVSKWLIQIFINYVYIWILFLPYNCFSQAEIICTQNYTAAWLSNLVLDLFG